MDNDQARRVLPACVVHGNMVNLIPFISSWLEQFLAIWSIYIVLTVDHVDGPHCTTFHRDVAIAATWRC